MNRRVPVTNVGRRGDVGGVVIGSHERSNMRVDTILQQACAHGTLRLANRNLTEIPREVFFLHETDFKDKRWWEEQDLTVFDISNNLIASIPLPSEVMAPHQVGDAVTMPAFANLRLLNAAYNKLTQFPSVLVHSCRRTLTKLDLSHNNLNGEGGFLFSAPTNASRADIVVLESMLELDLSHNRLSNLCNVLSACPRLEKLQASNNILAEWTEGDGRSVTANISLRHVDVSNNRLTTLFWTSPTTVVTFAQRCPNLQHLHASKNSLTCDGVDPSGQATASGLRVSDQLAAFPASMITLDLKFNRLGRWPTQLFGGTHMPPLSNLKELYVGRNQLQSPPSAVASSGAASRLPLLEMLDASDNQISDAGFLIGLKSSLSRLNLQNNNLSNLPVELGFFPNLKSVLLEGNPLRAIRRDVLEKGTVELLQFLRDRMSPGAAAEANGKTSAGVVRQLDTSMIPPQPQQVAQPRSMEESSSRYVLGRRQPVPVEASRADDRPFATAFNTADRIPDELKTLNDACVRVGEHSGTHWNLNGRAAVGGGGVAPRVTSSTRRGGAAIGAPHDLGSGAGNSGLVVDLPEVVSGSLNFAELHSTTEQRFRDTVQTISMESQRNVRVLCLDFLMPFTKLREVKCTRCSSLETLQVAHRQAQGPLSENQQEPLATLISLDLSSCGITSSADGSAPSSIDPALELLSLWRTPLSRLNLASNKKLCSIPRGIVHLAPSLQYLRLDDNANIGGGQSLSTWRILGQLNGLVELSLSRCNIVEMPADGDSQLPHIDPQRGFCESSWPRLQLLDISSNELSTIPNTLGLMKGHLRQLLMEGNRVRWLRQETLSKGTSAVLQFLEDRIPR